MCYSGSGPMCVSHDYKNYIKYDLYFKISDEKPILLGHVFSSYNFLYNCCHSVKPVKYFHGSN